MVRFASAGLNQCQMSAVGVRLAAVARLIGEVRGDAGNILHHMLGPREDGGIEALQETPLGCRGRKGGDNIGVIDMSGAERLNGLDAIHTGKRSPDFCRRHILGILSPPCPTVQAHAERHRWRSRETRLAPPDRTAGTIQGQGIK